MVFDEFGTKVRREVGVSCCDVTGEVRNLASVILLTLPGAVRKPHLIRIAPQDIHALIGLNHGGALCFYKHASPIGLKTGPAAFPGQEGQFL